MFGLLVGVGLGGFWLGRRQGSPADVATVMNSASGRPEESRLREDNARLLAENETLKKKPVAAEAERTSSSGAPAGIASKVSRMEQLHMLAEAQKEKTAQVRVTLTSREGKLLEGFTKLFGVTEAEKETLQRALDQGRQKIEQLTAANASVTEADGAVVVAVRAFDGGEVYDGLMDAFAQTLGPERNAAFVALQSDQLGSAFNSFGAEQRTIFLSREAPADGGEPGIALRDQRRMPTGGGTSMTMGSPVADLSKLPAQYQWLVPLVPQVAQLPVRVRPSGPPRPDTIRP